MGKNKEKIKCYLHFCDGCEKPILDFEIKDTANGDKIVDAYCPKCQEKDPLVKLFCEVIKERTSSQA